MVLLFLCGLFSAGYNSSVEKERLGNIMAFGSEVGEDQSSTKKRPQRHEEDLEEVDRFEEGRPVYNTPSITTCL